MRPDCINELLDLSKCLINEHKHLDKTFEDEWVGILKESCCVSLREIAIFDKKQADIISKYCSHVNDLYSKLIPFCDEVKDYITILINEYQSDKILHQGLVIILYESMRYLRKELHKASDCINCFSSGLGGEVNDAYCHLVRTYLIIDSYLTDTLLVFKF